MACPMGFFIWLEGGGPGARTAQRTRCGRGGKGGRHLPDRPPAKDPRAGRRKSPDIGLSVAGCRFVPYEFKSKFDGDGDGGGTGGEFPGRGRGGCFRCACACRAV